MTTTSNNRYIGFVKPHIENDHYVLGAEMVPKLVLKPEGQWGPGDMPVSEKQFNGDLETAGCTVFGTLNALEILKKAVDGEDNYSDRFTYIVTETAPPGNDPHVIAESIREAGVILETLLPFSSDITTLDKFRDMGDKGAAFLELALEWLKRYKFLHEWVFNEKASLAEKQKNLMECLKYSPLGISVYAWIMGENGLYIKPEGSGDNHWCVLVGYVEGEYWVVLDTYPQDDGGYLKRLEWGYDFGFAKRYYLQKKTKPDTTPALPAPKLSIFQRFINFIKKILKIS